MPEEVFFALSRFSLLQHITQIEINDSIINAITEITELYKCGAITANNMIEAFRCLGIE